MGGYDGRNQTTAAVARYDIKRDSWTRVRSMPVGLNHTQAAAYELGFESVAAGPLVRSSYHADQNLPEGKRAESLIA